MCIVFIAMNLYHSMLFFSMYLLDSHFLCSERHHFLSLTKALGMKTAVLSCTASLFPVEGLGAQSQRWLTSFLSNNSFISQP